MGFSVWHLILFGGVLVAFFGSNRLPAFGRSIGEAVKGFKKGLKGDEIDVTDSVKRLDPDKKDSSD